MGAAMTDAQKRANRNVTLLFLHTVCVNMVFILPVLVPYYRDVIGIGFREFMIGEAAFSAVMILMEVPTGWLSDVWGRRKTMIASAIAALAGWSLLWHADSFTEAVIAQASLGVAVSLISGTNSALLYDSLLEAGREGEYRRLEGRRHGIGLYAVGVASLLGGFMYQWDPTAPVIAVVIVEVLALAVALALTEPVRHREAVRANPFVDMAETVRYAVHGHVEIAGIILLSAVLFAATKNLMWAQQPYYIMLHLPEGWFGVLMAVGFLLGGTASAFGHRLDGRLSNIGVLRSLMLWTIVAAVLAGLFPGYGGVALLLSGSFIYGMGYPRVQAAINKRVSSARRATILSAASLSVHVFSIPLMLLTGHVAGLYGIRAALIMLAVLTGIGGAIAVLIIKMRNRSGAGVSGG